MRQISYLKRVGTIIGSLQKIRQTQTDKSQIGTRKHSCKKFLFEKDNFNVNWIWFWTHNSPKMKSIVKQVEHLSCFFPMNE
jgi:hypothetical protein